MRRIASPTELRTEIVKLVQACEQEGVSRTAMAEKLRELAARLAAKAPAVTNKQIQSLRQEAGQAGDSDMVKICDKALNGNMKARAECARVISENSSHTAAAKKYFVEAPATPGASPTRKPARNLADARSIAKTFKDRSDLKRQDVRIELEDGSLVEYAGPAR